MKEAALAPAAPELHLVWEGTSGEVLKGAGWGRQGTASVVTEE